MVDIEKMGPCIGGEFLQISAVSFEFGQVVEPVEILENKDRFISLCIKRGNGTVGGDAKRLWDSAECRDALAYIEAQPTVPLRDGLAALSSFVKSYLGKKACMWSKPPSYDLVALEEGYHKHRMKTPWHYRQQGCVRTLIRLADRVPREKFKVPDLSAKGLVRHNALHDCVAQTILCQGAYRALLLQQSGRNV